MDKSHIPSGGWLNRPSLHPERAIWLRRVDGVAQIVGVLAVLIGHGLRRTGIPPWEFGAVTILAMAVIATAVSFRYRWSLAKLTFAQRHLTTVLAGASWVVGMVVVMIIGPLLPDTNGPGWGDGRWWGCVHWSEFVLIAYASTGFVRALRLAASGGVNPAFLLILSFLLLISFGTVALMLPVCKASDFDAPLTGAPFLTALFTATSASCVTGLVVEHTAEYWSPVGQVVILLLFQIGGLGIMTFGAFFAAIAGRNVRLSEYATLRDLFASEILGDVRKLVFAILGFTFGSELVGAVLLLPLFSGPADERFFQALFHSVSAFCNAGFALTPDSFVGMSHRWQVSVVVPVLIIIGGLGFAVLYNVSAVCLNLGRRITHPDTFHLPTNRVRMRVTTKIVLTTTFWLLVGGTAMIWLLERASPRENVAAINLTDAWFQSVTMRTAGFNTVDLGTFQPATKLFAVALMVIGASPGSTGGGVKTTVFAIVLVALYSVLRGRDRIEVFGRTIPAVNVNRATGILIAFVLTIMMSLLLVVIFERRPDLFLDHVFEVASAAGTVGLSSSTVLSDGTTVSITQTLTPASRFVIAFTMFLGRVGPLTLLLALAGESPAVRYEYPPERVTLG